MKTTDKQYNKFNQEYSDNTEQNYVADNDFYQMLSKNIKKKVILDIGCGDGHDLKKITNSNSNIFRIDPSEAFIDQAKKEVPEGTFEIAYGESLPYKNNFFDLVISKYAIQTSTDAKKCLNEAARVLKSNGILHILVKHPIQQFLEKKKSKGRPVNYFTQEITQSLIYDGLITLEEPTHKMEDYFNADFFKNFELINYRENFDFPASEQIDGDIYPTYFVLTARKNNMEKQQTKKGLRIAVFSSAYNNPTKEQIVVAHDLANQLSQIQCTILTGGCVGLPAVVAHKAQENGTETIAYFPDLSQKELIKNKDIHNNDIKGKYTESKFYDGFTQRSIEMIKDADIAIAFNGRLGTLSEITVAIEEGLAIGILEDSGGISDQMRNLFTVVNRDLEQDNIIIDNNISDLINTLIKIKNI